MSTKRLVKRIIQQSPYIEQIARKYQTKLDNRNHPAWSFSLKYDLWSKTINTEEAERLSGIQIKIDHLSHSNHVLIIGGKTTGSSDEIFKLSSGQGFAELHEVLESAPDGAVLVIYSPHPFWVNLYQGYSWVPSWDELYAFFYAEPEWCILQYSPSFDPSGRYFFIVQKMLKERFLCPVSDLGRRNYHVFYYRDGADLSLGRSNYALSAHLCHALRVTGAKVFAHDFFDTDALGKVNPDDVLIGHVGPWVKEAANRGFTNLILYNPSNRWYPTRNSSLFEGNATIEEQVSLVKLVIAQSGMIWRLTGDVPDPTKWRWIDLGVDASLFPLAKREFNIPGKRRFLFFHLYDSNQKGLDIAEEIIRIRPTDEFFWVGGARTNKSKNLQIRPPIPNTSKRFRQVIGKCDFILSPSREDAQPGTVIEVASIGLLPVNTYTSGYSISFPSLINPNNPENWSRVVDDLQKMDIDTLDEAQNFIQHYLRSIHNWYRIENQVLFYLREALS